METLVETTKAWLAQGTSQSGVDIDKLASELDLKDGSAQEKVVFHSLDILGQLQSLIAGTPKEDVMAIALDDMKIISSLMQIIVCYGIYPATEPGVGLPLDNRTNWKVQKGGVSTTSLEAIESKLAEILLNKDDVADIITIGPYMIDVLAGAASSPPIFDKICAALPTYTLYSDFVQLLASQGPSWYQALLSHHLAVLPVVRNDAVKALIQFFTGYRESDEMSIDNLDKVVSVLRAVPRDVDPRTYIKVVGTQLFSILSTLTTPPDITTATVTVVTTLAQVRPQALGPLRDCIVTPLISPSSTAALEGSLLALTHLAKAPNSFVGWLGPRLAVPVWLVFVQLTESGKANGSTLGLLTLLIDDSPGPAVVDAITNSLMVNEVNGVGCGSGPDGEICMQRVSPSTDSFDIQTIESRIALFLTVLAKVQDKRVTELFVSVLQRYTSQRQSVSEASELLVAGKLLERIADDLKAKLLSSPQEIVDLALAILKGAAAPSSKTTQDDDNSDLVELCLSLLSGLIMECFSDKAVVDAIAQNKATFEFFAHSKDARVKAKAQYCLNLLETVLSGNEIKLGSDEHVDYNDPKSVLRLAKESLNDPLIPVRAHGLSLVTKLVGSEDPHLTLAEAMDIFLLEIKDDDSFIYLNAIRGIEACSKTYGPDGVVSLLLNYKGELDSELRVREALMRTIQSTGDKLSTEARQNLANVLLASIRSKSQNDDRLRMSSMSLLGALISNAPFGLTPGQENEVAETVLSVLTDERSEDQSILRRSALMLIVDVANAVAEGAFKSLSPKTIQAVVAQLQVATQDSDELVRKQAVEILQALG